MWSLLLAAPEQVDLGDLSCAFVRSAFGGVDPAQKRAPVELCQPVEERAGVRVGCERSGDIVGEIAPLRSLWCQHDLHGVARTDAAVATPRRAEHDAVAVAERFDRGPHVHAVDGAVDAMVGLGTPRGVGIERHRDHDSLSFAGGDDDRVVGAGIGHHCCDRTECPASRSTARRRRRRRVAPWSVSLDSHPA